MGTSRRNQSVSSARGHAAGGCVNRSRFTRQAMTYRGLEVYSAKTGNRMPFDKNKAAQTATAGALPPFVIGKCAEYVRKALEAGGLNTVGHPSPAKDWGPTLIRIGFQAIADTSYNPQI